MKAHTTSRAVAVLATLAVVVGWLWKSDSPVGVVVITMDTTRADRLTPYGFSGADMPSLERIAREAVVFDQATSVAPLTLPAHASLFTGLYPPSHGVHENAGAALASTYTTLAEVLQSHGFRTAAFVGSVVLNADRGLTQGFDLYRSAASLDEDSIARRRRRADEVIADATAWLNRAGRSRFFLWAHLYDPHRPYDPPEPYRSRYADQYIAEIAFADAQIGRLLDALDRRGRLERTIVVLAGDHGESLGEHGESDHGIFVYNNVLRVPLMIRVPGFPQGRIASVVRLVDVMPTLLELCGIDPPPGDGVSLAGLMTGREPQGDREAYAESMYPLRFGWSPLRSLRDGRFKVIDAPQRELYDLAVDPFEQTNLYDARRPLADAMIRRLHAVGAERDGREAPEKATAAVAEELRARLAALGYVGSAPNVNSSGPASLPDPKEGIATLNRDRTAFRPVIR